MPRLPALVLVLGTALAARASAQAPLFQLEGQLPFTAEELQAAVELRIPSWGALGGEELIVRGTGIDGGGRDVELELRGWRRSIALGSATGRDAARILALSIADLLLAARATLAPATPTSRPAPTPAPTAATPRPARTSAHHAPRGADTAKPGTWTRVALGPDVRKGLGALEPWSYGLDLAVSRASRPWVLDAELGFEVAPAADCPVVRSSWNAARVRVNAGLQLGLVELLAGPSLIPVWVSGGDGFFAVLSAVGVTARVVLPVGPSLDGFIAAGADVFLRRVQLQAYGIDTIATPRLAPWLGLALGWRGP